MLSSEAYMVIPITKPEFFAEWFAGSSRVCTAAPCSCGTSAWARSLKSSKATKVFFPLTVPPYSTLSMLDATLSQLVFGSSGPVRGVDFHQSQPLFCSGGDDYKIKVLLSSHPPQARCNEVSPREVLTQAYNRCGIIRCTDASSR